MDHSLLTALHTGAHQQSKALTILYVLLLVRRFAEQTPPLKLVEASAGSDLIGCHSAALDAEGRLYTWGVGVATGHCSLKPLLLPRCVGKKPNDCILCLGCSGVCGTKSNTPAAHGLRRLLNVKQLDHRLCLNERHTRELWTRSTSSIGRSLTYTVLKKGAPG